MKRTLAILLVISMLVCMLPAFSLGITAAEEPEDISGLNATLYQLKCADGVNNQRPEDFEAIIQGKNGRGADRSYNDSKHFDASIDTLLYCSKEWSEYTGQTVTEFGTIDKNGYILKWEGTITATESGTYYLVGRKIDNGFVAFIDDNGDGEIQDNEKFYEYWAENHWFDGSEDRLVTDLGGFSLEAGVPTKAVFWYLEMDGGDVCAINASKNADGSDDKSFGDQGLSLSLTRTCYISNIVINHDRINNVLPAGVRGGACTDAGHLDGEGNHSSGNCSSAADAGNHLYDSTIDAIKNQMLDLGTIKVANFERSSLNGLSKYGWRYEDGLILFEGYMTPTTTGTYQFGTSSVDNCLMIEINTNTTGEGDPVWTRAYEFWAGKVWNDSTKTYYDKTVDLVKDTSYQIRVAYLEVDGGEGLTTLVKIDGEEQALPTAVAFTTEKPTAPVKPSVINLFDDTQTWHYKLSGETNEFQIRDNAWMTDDAVYGTWATTDGYFGCWNGSEDNPVNNQSIWAVTEFEVADVSEYEGYELMAQVTWDDNIRMYVNGTLVQVELGWSNGVPTWSLGEEATDLLKNGTNTIAIKLVQGWGGFSVSVRSLYLTLDENTNNPYVFKYTDKNGVVQDGRIRTADQWLAYVADVNARGKTSSGSDRISIEADLDFDGKEWITINEYTGRIFGNGYTFSNITATATADATGGMQHVGMVFNALTNGGGNGLLVDLNFDNCTFTVNGTNGADRSKYVIAGMIAGVADRGRIENVTVSNSTLAGTAGAAAGIAGKLQWSYNDNGVYAENCGVINTTITATALASASVVYARYGDRANLGHLYVEDVTLSAPKTAAGFVETWDGNNTRHYATTFEGTNRFGQTMTPSGEYQFFWQTRDAGNGNVDVRIICVTTEEWLKAAESAKVTLTLTDGTTPKSAQVTPDTFYQSVTATSNGVTDVYTGGEGTVIFGWVIKGVPADYATNGNPPTASFN